MLELKTSGVHRHSMQTSSIQGKGPGAGEVRCQAAFGWEKEPRFLCNSLCQFANVTEMSLSLHHLQTFLYGV